MGYRVRSADGEIEFKDFADLEKAYRGGLVDPSDELLEDGRTKWVTVGSIKLLAGSRPPEHAGLAGLFTHPEKRWYAFAGVLVLIGIVMVVSRSWWVAGVLAALVLLGMLTYTTRQGFKTKRSR